MKKYFIEGSAALVLCGLMASCSHDEMDYSSIVEGKKAAYQEVFVEAYGKIDPNQTWGFGATTTNQTRMLTRAVDQWTLEHNDDWMSYLEFTKPADCIEVKGGTKLSGSDTYYVPETYTGAVEFDNFSGKLYVDGTITSFSGNVGTVGLYILKKGTWKPTSTFSTGTITIYNQGSLILPAGALNSQNLKTVYNGGSVVIGDGNSGADFANGVSLYSNSEGTIEVIGKTNGEEVDLKLACDIHGTMNVTGNLKIQNGRTQYICGLVVSETLNMTQGKLETSYVKANEITFDGAHIWLLPQGHIVANKISMPNSASEIYGHTNSYALVEAIDWYFRNHNNFENTFSSNIYFKVDGYIDIEERVDRDNGNGGTQTNNETNKYNTIAEYLASQNGQKLDASRFNGDVSGSPACGAPYGNTDITIPTDKGETTGNRVEVKTITKKYKTTELIDAGRVFCEDLGQISTNDLDFNDVVFDAYIYKITKSTQTIVEVDGVEESNETETAEEDATYKTAIVLLAAGGTLQLSLAGYEVHDKLGGNPISTIINTATIDDEAHNNPWVYNAPVILGEDFSYSSIVEIPIIVLYGNGETLELTAAQGWAPHKIRVPIGTKWCKERINIADAYKDFNNYVNSSKNFWEGEMDDNLLYPSEVNYSLTTKEGTVLVEEKEEISYRNEGSTTTGGYQGETVLSRKK